MDDETKQKLIAAGRPDLGEAHEISISGWAGILPYDGRIVDRRKFPEAIPVQKNSMLNLPEPKQLLAGAAYDYESDQYEVTLLGIRGGKLATIKEREVTAARARELIFEYNQSLV
jgi:hypothetical protein